MKMKRSERMVDMTATLLNKPNHLFSLNEFTEKYQSAKSSISEDLDIIKETFKENEWGIVETLTGANGGVIYYPVVSKNTQKEWVKEFIHILDNPKRILPGGYFYLSDIITDPECLKKIGKIIASQHKGQKIDYVLTVATKGVSLAQAVAYELGVPFIIARKETKVTEGSTVSVKYRSKSAPNLVKNMEVGRESIKENSKILIIDDFFRGGGTLNGMAALVEIFKSKIVGAYVFCEYLDEKLSQKVNPKSIVLIKEMDIDKGTLDIGLGNVLE